MNDDATTVLDWTFEPMDLFEVTVDVEILCGSVHIENGFARGYFSPSEFERGSKFRKEAHRELEPHFLGQAIIAGKRFVLNLGELAIEYGDGRRAVAVLPGCGNATGVGLPVAVDGVVCGKDGDITSDSRAERIADQADFRAKVVDALPGCPEIRAMAASLHKSFEDEANCFVHLYEVRDCIQTILGGAKDAKRALNAEDDWRIIGELSNRPENALGRHRGKATALKKPDQGTLRIARDATRRLIVAYIDHVSRS